MGLAPATPAPAKLARLTGGVTLASWEYQNTINAQPIFPMGFSRHIPPLETPIPGLLLASMSQVYPWDRGTNYAVEIGRKAAGAIARTE